MTKTGYKHNTNISIGSTQFDATSRNVKRKNIIEQKGKCLYSTIIEAEFN